jgi:peptidoglycan hydrolase-like protein with peptidoglycan-binding domain
MPVQKMEVPNLFWLKRIVRKGSEGKDVKTLQQRLDTLNAFYNYYPGQTLEATGSFGRKTHNFVTYFQIWADLCTDGWVDKATADTIEDFFQSIAQTYAIPATDMSHPMWDKYN